MSLGEEQLKRIQEKLQQVLKNQSALQKENQTLKEELNNSKKQAMQHHESIDRLKQQVEVLKLGNGEMSETEKKQFEKRINAYLKEIDRCIAMLSA
jgi:predicted  nucleic acid-binding Zn-ribbon protein